MCPEPNANQPVERDEAISLEGLRARPASGWTVPELARLLRVSPDKVRGWIKRGELEAINTSDAQCLKPRFVVLPDALERFRRGRSPAQPKPAKRRKRRVAEEVDLLPHW